MRASRSALLSLCTAVGVFVALGLYVAPGPAAEPLPSLDELLKLYTDLGLPLPPKDAKLVRYEVERKGQTEYYLAIPIKPLDAEFKAKEIAPEPSAADGVKIGQLNGRLAIECHSLGWSKLAERILELSQKDAKEPLKKKLINDAWSYWQGQ